jgi:DNA-nicking Smr family endonuclease
MQTLDLHGTKHHKVDEKVRSFLNFVELPCQIITGKSPEMQRIVKSIVEEYEWFYQVKDSYNYGTLVITERMI